MSNKLLSTAIKLDDQINTIEVNLDLLEDVEVALGQLSTEMDEARAKGVTFCGAAFHEYHRSVRLTSALLHRLVAELRQEHETTQKTGACILNEVRGLEICKQL